jgi:hypothetical protein
MAMDAASRFRIVSPQNIVYEIAVAGDAVVLKDSTVLFVDLDRLPEVLHRESAGMVPAVFGLRYVFVHEIVWEVTVHARGDSVVTCLLPGVKLGLHDMAVGTRLGVLGKIG